MLQKGGNVSDLLLGHYVKPVGSEEDGKEQGQDESESHWGAQRCEADCTLCVVDALRFAY